MSTCEHQTVTNGGAFKLLSSVDITSQATIWNGLFDNMCLGLWQVWQSYVWFHSSVRVSRPSERIDDPDDLDDFLEVMSSLSPISHATH